MVSRRTFLARAAITPVGVLGACAAPAFWIKAAATEGTPDSAGAKATAERLQAQINALAGSGGGTLRLAEAEIAIDRALVVPMGVSIIGPGSDRCLIRNTFAPAGGGYHYYRNALFMPGNFHPAYTQNLLGDPNSRPIRSFAAGDNAAELARAADAGGFATGDMVVFFDRRSYTSQHRLFRYLALRRITQVSGSILRVDEPFRDAVSAGYAYNLRTGAILGHGPADGASWLRLFAWGNAEIGGFAAWTNGHMIADSAVYKGAFHDIDVRRSRSLWYGNCYQHTQWDGVGGRFMNGAGELSHNSEASEVRNFVAVYDGAAAAAAGTRFSSGISMQENGIDVTYRDGSIDVTGTSHGNVVQIINFERAKLLGLDLRGRTPDFAGNVLSLSNADVPNRRGARDGEFHLRWDGPCGRYLLVQGPTIAGNLIDGDFRGAPRSGEAFRFEGATARNVIAPTARFERGRGRLVSGTSHQEIAGCYVGGGMQSYGASDEAVLAANHVIDIRRAP